MCEECLQYGTQVTGTACTEQERSAGFSGPTGDPQTPKAGVGDMDCAEPFVVRRAEVQLTAAQQKVEEAKAESHS